MKLSIASGKGGTGKTTVSVNLAKIFDSPVLLLDCDVEEPNAHLFLPGTLREKEVSTIFIPSVDKTLCDGCGRCSQFCQYHAIVVFGKSPMIFSEMCHGCGGCAKICPKGAIQEVKKRIGVIEEKKTGKITLIQGRLDVGVAMSPPLIREVKKYSQQSKMVILDAPPGTSCPVVATVKDSDFVLLVTEPTPFGFHDLKLAVEMVRELRLPFGVVVNRVGMGDDRVHLFCQTEKIPILLEIPDDRKIAEAYSQGKLMVDEFPQYRELFLKFREKIFPLLNFKERAS